jgi:hypothetical protein
MVSTKLEKVSLRHFSAHIASYLTQVVEQGVCLLLSSHQPERSAADLSTGIRFCVCRHAVSKFQKSGAKGNCPPS